MVIFKQSMKRILQNKLRLIILLIMPVVFIMLYALQSHVTLTIGIVDKDNSILSKRLVENVTNMDEVKVLKIDENEVYDRAASYLTDYTLIIESGFEDKLIKGGNPEVNEFYLQDKEKLFYARNLVEGFINDMKILASGSNYNRDMFFKELKNYDESKLKIQNPDDRNKTADNTRGAMGFLMQFMLYMSVVTSGLLLEDKSSGVYYRTFYGPVTLKRYIFENLLAFLLVALAQVTFIFGLTRFVFKLHFGSSPISMYILFMIFSLVCVSLGMWLVSLFKRPIGAYAAIMLVTTPLEMLGGGYWPMNFMPETIQRIARFMPTAWVMEGVDRILYKGMGLPGISIQLVVLLIFAGIFMSLGLAKKVDITR